MKKPKRDPANQRSVDGDRMGPSWWMTSREDLNRLALEHAPLMHKKGEWIAPPSLRREA